MFVFSTRHKDNVVMAYAKGEWAVNRPKNPNQMFERAEKVRPGDLALFWVANDSPYDSSRLLMPSIITSIPDIEDTRVDDPWLGEWCCPFAIRPLMHYDSHHMTIEELRTIFGDKTSNKLYMSGNMVFTPVNLTSDEINPILDCFFKK